MDSISEYTHVQYIILLMCYMINQDVTYFKHANKNKFLL